jgi:hypothetical protein
MITESTLINLGFKYERAKTMIDSRIVAFDIRSILERLTLENQAEARRLIEIGRAEARL